MHFKPRAIEDEVLDGAGVAADPQSGHEASGGMPHQGQRAGLLPMPIRRADHIDGFADFGVVIVQVLNVTARPVRLQAAAMVVHVQRVEMEALSRPELRQGDVEKVVAPSVQEQDRTVGGRGKPPGLSAPWRGTCRTSVARRTTPSGPAASKAQLSKSAPRISVCHSMGTA